MKHWLLAMALVVLTATCGSTSSPERCIIPLGGSRGLK